MRSADKIALMDALYGTNGNTLAAGDALLVIHGCEIVLYVDCVCGACLFALTASDTSVFAGAAHLCALVVA